MQILPTYVQTLQNGIPNPTISPALIHSAYKFEQPGNVFSAKTIRFIENPEMERSAMSISLLVLAYLVVSAAAQTAETTTHMFGNNEKNDQQCHCEPTPPGTGESNVIAFLKDFHPKQNNWNYPSYAACIDLDGDKPLEWRKRYGWTGFCGKAGPRGRNACGCCIKVTNSATNASETVRVIHTCGSGALELDRETAFAPLDTTGEGNAAGYLTVDYEFVECGDSVQSSLPVYSQ